MQNKKDKSCAWTWIGFCFVALLIMKLIGVDLPWWVVFSPLIFAAVFTVVVIAIAVAFVGGEK